MDFNVENIIEAKKMIEEVRRAISKLKPAEIELITNLFYKEVKIRELAVKLNISHPAVIKRRNKILKKLDEILGE